MSDQPTWIYCLCEPGTEKAAGEIPPPASVRYVGKTRMRPAKRLKQHIRARIGCHRSYWIRSLTAQGLAPIMVVVEEVASDDWAERERWWIAHYRSLGANLTNHTDGGEGTPGLRPSLESRARMSESQKRFLSDSRHRQIFLERGALARAKRWGDEMRAQSAAVMSEHMVAQWSDPEMRARRSAGVSIGAQAAWDNPDKAMARREKVRTTRQRSSERCGSTGFFGVCFDYHGGSEKRKWRARISDGEKRIHLGRFPTAEAAARAYDAKARELYGNDTRLNFPDAPAPQIGPQLAFALDD